LDLFAKKYLAKSAFPPALQDKAGQFASQRAFVQGIGFNSIQKGTKKWQTFE
jgi:hypothetical protein